MLIKIRNFPDMMPYYRYLLLIFTSVIIPFSIMNSVLAQSVEQTTQSDSLITGDSNNVIQIPNQNNAQNNNNNEIDIDYITPLVSPPNVENDFGLNLSVGVNQSETTVYMGVIFQPGRTTTHETKMRYLNQQIELLQIQTQIAETRLKLLEKQLEE